MKTAERMAAPATAPLMTMNRWDTQYAMAHRLGRKIVEIPRIGVDTERPKPVDERERAALRAVQAYALERVLPDVMAQYAALVPQTWPAPAGTA